MYPRFPGQLGTWLVTDAQVFPAFNCPVFPVVSHYHLRNILLGQQKVRDTQPGPPVVPWVYCWFASSLLVTECTRKEITIFTTFQIRHEGWSIHSWSYVQLVTTAAFTQEQKEVSKYLCHPFFQIYLLGHSSQRTKLWNLETKNEEFSISLFSPNFNIKS